MTDFRNVYPFTRVVKKACALGSGLIQPEKSLGTHTHILHCATAGQFPGRRNSGSEREVDKIRPFTAHSASFICSWKQGEFQMLLAVEEQKQGLSPGHRN